ncbi:MAG: oxygen-independent coproporphyrinogen III oxidase [Clostridiaceae bacterium]|jgi:oxygen-independent coproporphyrinogen-3 oxidase|nr:oxygen-independent coproporphyrinogen III oxidase [Clostridiaceae bacterium]
MNINELGLYIHIPFCKSKCYYCDFNSYASKSEIIPIYCNALIKEIEYYDSIINKNKYRVKSVFIGGGTPSFIDSEYLAKILEKCRDIFELEENAEITIEANPGTLSKEKLNAYKSAEINRLSLGLQAWQDRLLKSLGRIHTAAEFVENLFAAREVGFNNISVDLIFGLPGQSLSEWLQTLDNVIKLNVNHLSCYSLKIEEGTVLHEKIKNCEIAYPDEELDRDMYHKTIAILNKNGFIHYEISNFSRPGFESIHNLIYWNVEPYIGIGAGAHSYFEGTRYNNEEIPENYISAISEGKIPKKNIDVLTFQDSISEYLILGLRLTRGIKIEEFKQKFGKDLFELYGGKIDNLIKRELIRIENGHLKLTAIGLDLANQVFLEFI